MLVQKIFERYKNASIFTKKDLLLFLQEDSKKINSLISYLIKQKKIYRLGPGQYSLNSNPLVIGFAYRPFYYGLQNALTIHNLWGQATNPVIITSKKARIGEKEINGQKVIIHRIKQKYLGGFELKEVSGINVPVSDLEKTYIDFFHFKIKLDKNTKEEILKKINKKKLKDYLQIYPKSIQTTVLKG